MSNYYVHCTQSWTLDEITELSTDDYMNQRVFYEFRMPDEWVIRTSRFPKYGVVMCFSANEYNLQQAINIFKREVYGIKEDDLKHEPYG